MIEAKIDELISAVKELTAALGAKSAQSAETTDSADAGKGATAGKATRGRAAATKSAPKSEHTQSEMQAALNKVKENLGTPAAKAVIKEAGFAKMADITEDKYDEVYKACQAALGDDEGEDDDDGM